MKALVLAAGKGTRLGALTAATPKPMLPVGGVPLLGRILAWLRDAGVREVAINLHHAADVITRYVGDGSAFDVAVTWSYEETLLGTAGAAKRLQAFLDERFLVVYGDVFWNIDVQRLVDFHCAQLAQGQRSDGLTMALYRVPNPTECGLVELADEQGGQVLRFVEKPPAHEVFTDLANAGLYVCEPALLELVPAEQPWDFGRDLLPLMLERGWPVFGLPLAPGEFVIDIGTPAGLQRAEAQAGQVATPESVAVLRH